MGKASREKGKRGEREVAKILREHGYTGARRGQQYEGSSNSPDVIGIPGVHLEVKRVEKLHLWDALKQAEGDCGDNIPVVVHRANDRKWVAILDFETFISLCYGSQMANAEGCSELSEYDQNTIPV